MPKGSRALAKCRIAFAGYSRQHMENGARWVRSMGGAVTGTSVDETTTHVIASKEAWKNNHKLINSALEINANRNFQNAIKIISMDWIADSFEDRKKSSEGPYLWEKLEAHGRNGNQYSTQIAALSGPKRQSTQKMMKEMFLESTAMHVDEDFNRATEREIKARNKASELLEYEEKQREAEVFKKGAKKARNDIFTENHHIYTDTTNFKYDVTLTKVDTRANRNERYHLTLQIYESNAQPHTYAVNLQFAGTGIIPSNNLLAALGTNFPTAFHTFKDAFKAKTGVEWDNRLKHFEEKVRREKIERGQGTGSPEASRAGVPVGEPVKVRKEVPFEKMLFEYHPPKHGSKGLVAGQEMGEVAKVKNPRVGAEETREKVKAWIGSTNGENVQASAAEDKNGAPISAHGGIQQPNQESEMTIDLTEPDNVGEAEVQKSRETNDKSERVLEQVFEESYPFDRPLGSAEDNEEVANPDFAEFLNVLDKDVVTTGDADAGEKSVEPLQNDGQGVGGETGRTAAAEISFDTNKLTQADPCFNFPPSTVEESWIFQPDTQDIGETQLAERAANEFAEFADLLPGLAAQNKSMAPDVVAEDNVNLPAGEEFDTSEAPKSLNLGSSILVKRKAAEADDHASGSSQTKKAKTGGENEAAVGADVDALSQA